ncbi:hypothetical protein MHJ97_10135 [Macrococcus epidermidis]|uniref:hypothetical protein n=1 Tax=Macrococcus epidermidis TaxID=1902580 RepID=UPI001EF23E92|nr:hypothetical protein [Macrococcus epidermidis]MCG7420785.1 hypothetical protein [Macrococcus epidermidis]
MANIDKLVSYAELKLGQFGSDYRENHEEDKVQEIQPRSYDVNGTSIDVHYDAQSYIIDLTKSGVRDVTEEDAQAVVARLKEFFNQK